MSVIEPDDTSFEDIVGDLDFEMPTDVIDYTQLSDADLAMEFSETNKELLTLNKQHDMNPQGLSADLHSKMSAIQAEMFKRWNPQAGANNG